MDDLLHCNICIEKFNQTSRIPRVLKCGHTFCSFCLSNISKLPNCNLILCPIDKTQGSLNLIIEDIPINRVIIDIIDSTDTLNFDKLSLEDPKINVNKSIQLNLQTNYTSLLKLLNIYIAQFINEKNFCLQETINHYDKLIGLLQERKNDTLLRLENYSKESLFYLNSLSNQLSDEIKIIKNKSISNINENILFSKLMNVFKNLDEDISIKYNKDLYDYLSSLNLLQIEDKMINYPKIFYNDCDIVSLLSKTDIKLFLPKDSVDIDELENQMKSVSLSENNREKDEVFWFQQDSFNVFTKNVRNNSHENWVKLPIENPIRLPIMFRTCKINSNNILICGGVLNNNTTNDCNIFQTHINKYITSGSMIYPRKAHSLVNFKSFIYAIGGVDDRELPLSYCEKYCFINKTWIRCGRLRNSRSHASLCSFNNNIFCFGGENRQGMLDEIEVYSDIYDSWELINVKLPVKIECMSCLSTNNGIMIIGGYSLSKGMIDDVYQLTVKENDFQITKTNKKLDKAGWSIYEPILSNNIINIFLGGEEEYPPYHCKLSLTN